MHNNKKGDMTPFDFTQKPSRQHPALLPLIWAACFAATRPGKLKIRRSGMEGLRPPYLVLAEHQGFTDYFIAPIALFPQRASYVSDVEGFAAFGKTPYRLVGCVGTRRFAADPRLISHLRYVVEHNRDILVVFPEARHSNVGTNSALSPSIGKLVRLLGVPVVVLKSHGSYLSRPIWDESRQRRVPLSATLELVLTPEETRKLSPRKITDLLNRRFAYDEYRWQWEQRISIPDPRRAEGLHKVLYQCPCCGVECAMASQGDRLACKSCGKSWRMDEYGRLGAEAGLTPFSHIPDWYEFQRSQVAAQIAKGEYLVDIPVTVEALPNEKGFVPMGQGRLVHRREGFSLSVPSLGESLRFSSRAMPSVHTEYDYRHKGDAVVLSTRDCCYYLYPCYPLVSVTKIQFAAEAFHQLEKHRGPAPSGPSCSGLSATPPDEQLLYGGGTDLPLHGAEGGDI